MKNPNTSFLRNTFLVHVIIGGLLGAFLFLIPGRTLTWLGWVPEIVTVPNTELTAPGTVFVDPLITRLLGAALLSFAFSSFLGWRARTYEKVKLLVQTELVFCVLSSIAFFTFMILHGITMAVIGYVLLVVLLGFSAAWVWAYRHGTNA